MKFKIIERKVYSQAGEDGIIESIINNIGFYNKTCVEFGENGTGGNTSYLRESKKVKTILFDGDPKNSRSNKEFITVENINNIFQKYKVPNIFDILSIDIDGNDYWIWKALDTKYRPRIVIIEYNCNFPLNISKTIKYNDKHIYKRDIYYGASLTALKKLGNSKNYSLVFISSILNLVFVDNSLIKEEPNICNTFNFPLNIKQEVLKWRMKTNPSWLDLNTNQAKPDIYNREWVNI